MAWMLRFSTQCGHRWKDSRRCFNGISRRHTCSAQICAHGTPGCGGFFGSYPKDQGRRGLDVVNELQKLATLRVEILEISLKELQVDSVDQGLVALAKQISGKIITTDYNLNKIAQIRGVPVLNVNDLANALKPMLLPGESGTVDLIREGKEPHQGVGYLDDGTMIVVEEGDRYVGRRVDVVVTSMLQTSAGRMVFGRLRRDSHL